MAIHTKENRLLRVKIMSACNLACHFCHNEGTHSMFRAMQLSQFEEVLHFAQAHGFNDIHFTGGEPTLNKSLPSFIAAAKASSMQTGMTTNAQFNDLLLPSNFAKAGLDSVNVSLHSIRPAGWKNVQRNTLEKATVQLEKTLAGLDACLDTFKRVKLNIVVSEPEVALEVLEYAAKRGVFPRLLDILGSPSSLKAINEVLKSIDATLIETTDMIGTSQRKLKYQTKLGDVVVKQIRDFTFANICGGDTGNCFEKFYGVRIESQGTELYARLCLCHESPTTLMPLATFSTSKQLASILEAGRLA